MNFSTLKSILLASTLQISFGFARNDSLLLFARIYATKLSLSQSQIGLPHISLLTRSLEQLVISRRVNVDNSFLKHVVLMTDNYLHDLEPLKTWQR
jgi:hypothetical protein